MMNRRIMLTSIALLGLAVATLPERGLAQGDPLIGLWQLNVAKSKYSPGPAPKSGTLNIQGDGQNRKLTAVGINAAGNAAPVVVFSELVEDGKSHPVTGLAVDDVSTYTRVDAYTIKVTRLKDEKVVQTAIWVISLDGKTLTTHLTGINADGREVNDIMVFEKQ
jgi:hypothetical protein